MIVMNKSLQIYVSSTLPSMGINGVDAITFNSWALSVIRHATRGKAFFKYRELPEFVEKIKFSNGILGALSQFVSQQVRDVDAAISREFLTNEKLFKTLERKS